MIEKEQITLLKDNFCVPDIIYICYKYWKLEQDNTSGFMFLKGIAFLIGNTDLEQALRDLCQACSWHFTSKYLDNYYKDKEDLAAILKEHNKEMDVQLDYDFYAKKITFDDFKLYITELLKD